MKYTVFVVVVVDFAFVCLFLFVPDFDCVNEWNFKCYLFYWVLLGQISLFRPCDTKLF